MTVLKGCLPVQDLQEKEEIHAFFKKLEVGIILEFNDFYNKMSLLRTLRSYGRDQ